MKIDKLGHNDTYTVKTAENCYTFFDEFIHHEDIGSIELRVHSYVSGALYGDRVDEFLVAWEERK